MKINPFSLGYEAGYNTGMKIFNESLKLGNHLGDLMIKDSNPKFIISMKQNRKIMEILGVFHNETKQLLTDYEIKVKN